MALTPEQLSSHQLSTIRCYDTYDESLRAIGIEPSSTLRTTSDGAATNAEPVIAVHFDGSSNPLSIGGSLCNGGGVTFAAGSEWNDRIRTTSPRGCSTVKHWTEPDYTGSTETVSGGTRALSSALSGRVSSIRYF